ncbi:MAG: hypothetical protein Faunusvirus8_11 [Faunusvirus sp.]|jgi:hypothetical protein|uniref:Uncharacterized protein n=1 Tax=Faunusvirus sp. TaxID=2487766 RepID=A0A3G4ZYA4_9VIRU|nr:MAG: hypothetical protein Faunusvirus8_11 [Faunusvirus sp.]
MINTKHVTVVMGIIGFICIIVAITQTFTQYPPTKIEYKYIKQSVLDEQNNPTPLHDIFGDMFTNQSPWFASANIYDQPRVLTTVAH